MSCIQTLPEKFHEESRLISFWEDYTKSIKDQINPSIEGKLENLRNLFLLAAHQPGLIIGVESNPLQVIAQATAKLKATEYDDLFPRDMSNITLEKIFGILGYDKDEPECIGSQIALKLRERTPETARIIANNSIWT